VKNKSIRDLRSYARSTTFRLILGALVLIFIVGEILIYLIYGSAAATTGLICLVAGVVPVIFVLLSLWFIDWVGRKNKNQ
jgi:prepilin signal peptidase PulO-like enzyme (type II secretory pathway)